MIGVEFSCRLVGYGIAIDGISQICMQALAAEVAAKRSKGLWGMLSGMSASKSTSPSSVPLSVPGPGPMVARSSSCSGVDTTIDSDPLRDLKWEVITLTAQRDEAYSKSRAAESEAERWRLAATKADEENKRLLCQCEKVICLVCSCTVLC